MRKVKIILAVFLINGFFSCREEYDPPVIAAKQTFLVIEANLNPGPGAATVLLTRTQGLESRTGVQSVNNAVVTVEGKDNTTRSLPSTGSGVYSSVLNLMPGLEYRLRVRTVDGKEYLSEYVTARRTPAIDSISWEQDDKGVHIYANTHDPGRFSRYYRWSFEETWEIRSLFFSDVIYENGRIRNRVFPAEDVSVCWKYNNSSAIILANSTKLDEDIIFKAPITLIPPEDERLEVRYSILAKQFALDKAAYNFFEVMKKNTEEVGSIFAPQPSEVRGNISCITNKDEYVLGYVTASTIQEQRIFIKIPWRYNRSCPEIKVPLHPDSLAFVFGDRSRIPYAVDLFQGDAYGSYAECVDCTRRNGFKQKPSYW